MLMHKIYLRLHKNKYMGYNNNLLCGYNKDTKQYDFWYVKGLKYLFWGSVETRDRAKFKLYVLNN